MFPAVKKQGECSGPDLLFTLVNHGTTFYWVFVRMNIFSMTEENLAHEIYNSVLISDLLANPVPVSENTQKIAPRLEIFVSNTQMGTFNYSVSFILVYPHLFSFYFRN